MRATQLAVGIASFIPGFNQVYRRETGGTCSARYCYSVWLRHLVLASESGLGSPPRVVAELGPGDSLGTGLAALLSGVERYYAFDIVKFAGNERNLRIFDALVGLFATRAPIPDDSEFPLIRPRIRSYAFPRAILTEQRLSAALNPARIARLRHAVMHAEDTRGEVRYAAPWFDSATIERESIDMIFSQAVLEHVDELDDAYHAMRQWLKQTGIMTHTIDFKSHGLAPTWNGHWSYSDFAWKLLRGKRPFLINREPHSTHVSKLEAAGFALRRDECYESCGGIGREHVASRFSHITDGDLTTSESFIVAVPRQ
jgi:hypothetical protein